MCEGRQALVTCVALALCTQFGCGRAGAPPPAASPLDAAAASATVDAAMPDEPRGQDAAAPAAGAASVVDAGALDAGAAAKDADAMPARPSIREAWPPEFCTRAGVDVHEDAVREALCASRPPTIRSLKDLQLALSIVPGAANRSDTNYALLLGHSTSLSGHLVSPLNPRAIVLGQETTSAFQRGVQRVELMSKIRGSESFQFYLVSFEQPCNAQPAGCKPGDLYTPRIESDWTRVSVQDGEELKNTAADCRQCHQRGIDTPRLLMRELERPWTHFFDAQDPSPQPGVRGSDLLQDYLKAKGDEAYAGIDASTYNPSFAFILEQQVGQAQPLVFDALTIERERYPRAEDGSFPASPQPSPTWSQAYEAFKRGEQLALPYVEPRVTDPSKAAQLTAAYQRYRSGELGADALPDFADIFSDDPRTRAQLGLQTEPDASPSEALIQACGSCHNDVLDQSLTRARFNIDVAKLPRPEIELAIQRIELPRTAAGAMPPPDFRQLDPSARTRLLAYLRDGMTAAAGDPALKRAAQLGMRGKAR